LSGIAPSSSVSCNGVAIINPSIPAGCATTVNMGAVSGNSVTNLCYGTLNVCLGYTNEPSTCAICQTIVINGATGIKENSLEGGSEIFPNPNRGSFNVQLNKYLENTYLVLFNSIGERVFEQKMNEGTNPVNA